MTESLDQQIHRLLGHCWHEESHDWEEEVEAVDYAESWRPTCPKCKEKVPFKTFGRWDNNLDMCNPSYSTSLDTAWVCVEHIKELTFSQRLLFKDCIRQRCLWEKVSGQIIELDWNEVLFRVDSLVICKAFIEVMGEEPVE